MLSTHWLEFLTAFVVDIKHIQRVELNREELTQLLSQESMVPGWPRRIQKDPSCTGGDTSFLP